jgi:hypothetical protein
MRIRHRVSIVAAGVLFSLGSVGAAAAQMHAAAPAIRFAPGVSLQGGLFGDDDPEKADRQLGLSVSLQVRGQTTRRTGLSLETAFDLVGAPNPHLDETARTLHVLVGPEIGRTIYVRPAAGAALRLWSGPENESGPEFALTFGLAVGHRRPFGARGPGLEVATRAAISYGVLTWSVGLQVPIGR